MSGHRFKVGDFVEWGVSALQGFIRSPTYCRPHDEAFEYRIKNANQPHERVAKENELRGVV